MRIRSSYLSDRAKDDLIAMYGGDIDLSRPDKGMLLGVCLTDGEEATGDAADNLGILIENAPVYRSARLAASDEGQGGE